MRGVVGRTYGKGLRGVWVGLLQWVRVEEPAKVEVCVVYVSGAMLCYVVQKGEKGLDRV